MNQNLLRKIEDLNRRLQETDRLTKGLISTAGQHFNELERFFENSKQEFTRLLETSQRTIGQEKQRTDNLVREIKSEIQRLYKEIEDFKREVQDLSKK